MLYNRIVASAVSIFAIGVVFGIAIDTDDAAWYCLGLVVICVASVCAIRFLCSFEESRKRFLTRAAAIAVALCLLGIMLIWFWDYRIGFFDVYDGAEDMITGTVTECKSNFGTQSLTVKISSDTLDVKKNTLVLITVSDPLKGVIVGDKISCKAVYSKANGDYFLAENIKLTAKATEIKLENGSGLLYSIRKSVSKSCDRFFKTDNYVCAMAKAVTIGDTTGLDSYFYKLYNNAGISHVLSISGMHVSLVITLFFNVLAVFFLNYKIRSVVATVAAVLYMALLGFSPSVVRAVVMVTAAIVSRGIAKRTDTITMMFIALFILLLNNPYSILSKGLQLSFLCCAALILVSPFTRKLLFFFVDHGDKKSFVHKVFVKIGTIAVIPFVSSFVVVFFTVPVLFTQYDSFSYIAPLINVVAVPLFNIGLIFVLLCICVGFVSPFAAEYLSVVPEYLFDTITTMCQDIFSRDVGSISTHLPFMWVPLMASVCFVVILLFCSRRRGLLAMYSALIFMVALSGCVLLNTLRTHNLVTAQIGTGKSEYVYYSADESNIFIDLGGSYVQTDCIFRKGEVSVSQYVVTELTEESLSKTLSFLSRVNVKTLVIPYPKNNAETYVFDEIILLANRIKCDIIYYESEYVTKNVGTETALFLVGPVGDRQVSVFLRGGGKQIAVLSDGYDRSAVCDIAVVTDGYNGRSSAINCELLCASDIGVLTDSSVKTRCFSFEKSVTIEFYSGLGEYKVYES